MSRADSPLRERMIFAFGARRSGTFWLQRMVTAHPAVAAVPSETHLFSHGIKPLTERFQHAVRDSQQVGTVFIERERALDAVRDLCDAVFTQFLASGATRLCERTPTHAFHVDLIAAIYPDARFVHIIRDGRDVARSLVAQDFGPRTVPEAAEEWRTAVEAARAAALPPDRYLEVRYEDLLGDPRRALGELYDWLGLETAEQVLAQAVIESRRSRNVDRFSRPGIGTEKWRMEFSRDDLRAFTATAGDLLDELGYEAADPNELPRLSAVRRAFASLASMRSAAHRSLRRSRGGRSESEARMRSEGAMRQRQVDVLVEAIQAADANALRKLLIPNVLVRVVGPDGGERRARGEQGIELLREAATTDPALSARQTRGDVFPALPNFGLLLRYELPDGSVSHRVLFLELLGESFSGVTIYQLPAVAAEEERTVAQLRAE